MTNLHAHSNVYDSALAVLETWGYGVRVEEDLQENLLWHAEKEEFDFTATTPIELLGIVAIHRHVEPAEDAPYWWALTPSRSAGDLEVSAEKALEPVKALLGRANAFDLVRGAMVEARGDLRDAASRLGLSRGQLSMILGEPEFCRLEDEFE